MNLTDKDILLQENVYHTLHSEKNYYSKHHHSATKLIILSQRQNLFSISLPKIIYISYLGDHNVDLFFMYSSNIFIKYNLYNQYTSTEE